MRKERSDFLFIAMLVILAALVRLDFLIASNWVIDSDEAIVGLMAKHILEGSPFPVFYYGQHYMGSFEALVVALLSSLAGLSNITLKLAPLIFSLLMVPTMYSLGKSIGGNLAGRVAALLWAFPPSPLVIWSGMARGGFIEVLWLGAVATALTVSWLRSPQRSSTALLVIGLVLGFGWWVNNQIIYFAVPAAAFIGCHLLYEKFGKFPKMLKAAALGVSGFFIGSLPFWLYNIKHSFASFGILGRARLVDIPDHLLGLFNTALPMLFGAKRFWHQNDVFPAATAIVMLLYLGLALVIIALRGPALLQLLRLKVDPQRPVELFVSILIVAFAAFTLSSFGHLFTAPRYLLPIYVPLFVLVGFVVSVFWRLNRGLANFIPLLLLTISAASCYLGGRALPGQPFVASGQRVATDHTELIDWLATKGYSFVKTNYWIGYRLAFETQERVKFGIFKEPTQVRIPEYESLGASLPTHQVPYVLVPAQADALRIALKLLGFSFEEQRLSDYIVFHSISPNGEVASPVPRSVIGGKASSREAESSQAIDDNLGTRWGSGTPQNPTLWFELALKTPRRIRSLEYNAGPWATDIPKGLKITGVSPGGKEVPILSEHGYRSILWYREPATASWRIYFEPVLLSSIRLSQTGTDPVFDWSIGELSIME